MKKVIALSGMLDNTMGICIITEDDVNLEQSLIVVNGRIAPTINTPANHPLTGNHKYIIPRDKIILVTDAS